VIYGLYQSAAGMMTALHKQNVISNNLANAETVGFRRDLAMIQQRPTAAQELPALAGYGEDMLNALGGGQFLSKSESDFSSSILEVTGNAYDVGLKGEGYLVVSKGGQQFLTRDGRMTTDAAGQLVNAGNGATVLDKAGKPIFVDPQARLTIDNEGRITQHNAVIAQLGLKDAPAKTLTKVGEGLFSGRIPVAEMKTPDAPWVVQNAVERSNVEPTTEITLLLDAQRQLEANANMIRYQDQTLGRLVNDVAKVS
jgi:flagellar basal-body rod protein FlgF